MTFFNTCYTVTQLFILYYLCQLLLGAQQTNAGSSVDHLFLFGMISGPTLQNGWKMLCCSVGLVPWNKDWKERRWREPLGTGQFATFFSFLFIFSFEGIPSWFCLHLHKSNPERPSFHPERCVCYQKQRLLLPEAVFAARINFRHILSENSLMPAPDII